MSRSEVSEGSALLTELAPLAARVCPWLVPDVSHVHDQTQPDDQVEPDVVRAMPLVLRIERENGPVPPPTRTALLEASAAAALALCLDDRARGSQAGESQARESQARESQRSPAADTERPQRDSVNGPWAAAVAEWAGAGRIRKLARRARTAHWRAAEEVAGVTVGRDGAEVRALVPGPVDDVPHVIRRLQIGGTDLPADEPGPPPLGRPVIWLNPGVDQSTGKAAAQVGHASMILAVVVAASGGDPSVVLDAAVRRASDADWVRWCAALDADSSGRTAWEELGVVPVRDAGFTEVAPGTVTCLGELR